MKLPALLASLAAIVALFLASSASASIHSYDNDYFYSVGDAYIFRGGREGLYASTKEVRFLAWLVGGGEREQARKRKELRDVVVVLRRPFFMLVFVARGKPLGCCFFVLIFILKQRKRGLLAISGQKFAFFSVNGACRATEVGRD